MAARVRPKCGGRKLLAQNHGASEVNVLAEGRDATGRVVQRQRVVQDVVRSHSIHIVQCR